MANLNKVFLIGRLTGDPELRFTPNGAAVANFRIAVNRYYKGGDGEWVEEASFFTIVAWNRQAEQASQNMKKGTPILVEGRLQSRSWETPDGQKRTAVEVVAERLQTLDRGPGRGGEELLAGTADADLQALGEVDIDDVPF